MPAARAPAEGSLVRRSIPTPSLAAGWRKRGRSFGPLKPIEDWLEDASQGPANQDRGAAVMGEQRRLLAVVLAVRGPMAASAPG